MRESPSTPRAPDGERALRVTEVVVSDAFAGTERYVVQNANELARRGHDVHVIGGAPDTVPQLLDDDVRWSPGSSVPAAVRALLAGGRRDIVHGHMSRAEFSAFFAAAATRGRRLATRHIVMPRGHRRLARVFGRLVRAEMWAEVAVSEFVARSVRPRSELVLLNGTRVVDDSRIADAGPGSSRTVLCAERLDAEKKTDVVVRGFALSGLADRGWRLVVAGRGPEAPALRRLVDELAVSESVELRGWVDDISLLMSESTIFAAAATGEPCGLSILEAMAHGLAVVAPAAGGNPETVGALAGARLFPPDDVAALAAALGELACDDAGRGAYGTALLELQRSAYSVETHVDGLEKIYRAAAGGGSPREVAATLSPTARRT